MSSAKSRMYSETLKTDYCTNEPAENGQKQKEKKKPRNHGVSSSSHTSTETINCCHDIRIHAIVLTMKSQLGLTGNFG